MSDHDGVEQVITMAWRAHFDAPVSPRRLLRIKNLKKGIDELAPQLCLVVAAGPINVLVVSETLH